MSFSQLALPLRLSTRPDAWKSSGLILPVFSDDTPLRDLASCAALSWPTVSWLHESAACADHSGAVGELGVCHAPLRSSNPISGGKPVSGISRVLLPGLGKRGECGLDTLRRALAQAIRWCRERRMDAPGLSVPWVEWLAGEMKLAPEIVLEECVLGLMLPAYRYDRFRSVPVAGGAGRGKKAPFVFFGLNLLAEKRLPAAYKAALDRAEAQAAGVCQARDLANCPSNIMTPTTMAEAAQDLARRYGFGCRVLGRAEMETLGMGAFLAVSRGSVQEPRFIVLEYTPIGKKNAAPLVLVGKGVTFDTGGISLKPAAGMERMKMDMAGAAVVCGVFEAIGKNPAAVKNRVVGLLPCTENMPGGSAARPGDVVTSMKGITVEIVNTDAEGRLILCDALAYAQKEWRPAVIVDIASLTGACTVALGKQAGGLFCADASLRERLLAEGERTGERLWHLPLWENLRAGLASATADTMNSGPREGGAIIAALFLKSFIEDGIPWAHIDMSGPASSTAPTDTGPAGASGFGVRLLYEVVRTENIFGKR